VEELEDLVPEADREFLASKGYKFSATRIGADVHVIIEDFPLPEAYVPRVVSLKIILPAGYPNANLDMFWTLSHVTLATGGTPARSDTYEVHAGVSWQRWSRHFNIAWRQGVDDLRSYLATIRRELAKGI
jgi:Prokaryotic E2 family E